MGLKVAELFGDLKLKASDALGKLKKFNERLIKGEKLLTRQERAVDAVGKAWRRSGEIARRAGAKIVASLKRQAGASDGARANVKKLGGEFASLGKKVAAFAAVGTAAITAFAFKWSASVDDIGKTARKIGVSAAELQKLQFAAQISGASADQLTTSVRFLLQGMFDARTKGVGPLKEGFDEVGLAAEDFKGKSLEDTFGIIADAINKVEDPLDRTAIRLKIFGRQGGIALGELLNEGSPGIRKLIENAEELGGVVGVAGFKAAADFNDAWTRVKFTIGGLVDIFATRAVPIITEWIERVKDNIVANKELIGTQIDVWMQRVTMFLETAVPAAQAFIQTMFDTVEILGGVGNAIESVLIIWATFRIAMTALAFTGNPVVAGVLALVGAFVLLSNAIANANEERRKLERTASTELNLKGFDVGTLERSASFKDRNLARDIEDVATDQLALQRANVEVAAARKAGGAGLRATGETKKRFLRSVRLREDLVKSLNLKREAAQKSIDLARQEADATKRIAQNESSEAIAQIDRFHRETLEISRIADRKERKLAEESLKKKKARDKAERDQARKDKEALKNQPGELPTLGELIAGATGQGIAGAVGTFRPSGPGTTVNQITVNNSVGPTEVTIEIPGMETASPIEVANQVSNTLADVLDSRVREAFEAGTRQVIG